MEHSPARVSSFGIRSFAKLVMDKQIMSSLRSPALAGSFLQEQTLQDFIKGEESILRGQMGNLAEGLKGEVMVQDRPGHQEFTSRGRELGKAKLDHLAHVRRERDVR